MNQPLQESAAHYRATPLYAYLAGAALLAAGFCAWALWQQFDWITLIFLVGCLYAAVTYVIQWRSTVAIDAHGLWLNTPLQAHRVEFRQLDDAGVAGRVAHRIVVTYFPLRDNGLLDLDELRSVTLPAVDRQTELLTLLESKRPLPATNAP
jgi:hypothetical protein